MPRYYGGDLAVRKVRSMAHTKAATSIPVNGKDTWRTPPETLFLIHRMYGGPDVPGVAPMWQPRMWGLPDWHARYIEILTWLREQGTIALDPCADVSDLYHFATVNTSMVGLDPTYPWDTLAFANVPYSSTSRWVAHGAGQMAALRAARAWRGRGTLFLIPACPTNKYWVDFMLCPGQLEHPFGPGVNLFATKTGRISFIGPEGPVPNNPMGSALVGWVDPIMGDHMVRELELDGWVVHRRPGTGARIVWGPQAPAIARPALARTR